MGLQGTWEPTAYTYCLLPQRLAPHKGGALRNCCLAQSVGAAVVPKEQEQVGYGFGTTSRAGGGPHSETQVEPPPLKSRPVDVETNARLIRARGHQRKEPMGAGHSTRGQAHPHQAQKGRGWPEVISKSTSRPSFSRTQPVPANPQAVLGT